MQRCLELAKNGLGYTAPNPMVGCVIVHENKIVGEGFTSPYGGNHAEVNAINSVENKQILTQSKLYVSLEPCAHFGKTPPCSDLIISEGIPEVVIGIQDPFSKVDGAGIQRLRQAGIQVSVGLMEEECRWMNRRFFTFYEKKRPYVILKWAETKDGFVDAIRKNEKGSTLKISGNSANILVHKWRSEEQAILVGKGTALSDNPSLTTRNYAGKNPIRVLVDSNLEVPDSSNLHDDSSKTLIFNALRSETAGNVEFIKLDNPHEPKLILESLYERDIQSVLIEGGPTVHAAFHKAGLWDEIRRISSEDSIGNGIPALLLDSEPDETHKTGTDQLNIYFNKW